MSVLMPPAAAATEPEPKTIPARLGGVPETLMIPLAMRAAESRRTDAIIRDPTAERIVAAVDYDFTPLAGAWMTQADVAVRTEIIDEIVQSMLARYSRLVVANLGAGLDGRFDRLDNGRVRWFDIDLPEVVELRRRFFTESDRRRFIPRSLLDFAWIDDLARSPEEHVLVIAEGVLHYFPEGDVRRLMAEIADRLKGADLVVHTTSPACVRYQSRNRVFKTFQAPFAWGIATTRSLTAWDPRIDFVSEEAFVDRHPRRWRWLRWAKAIPGIGTELRASMKIAHLRFRS
jgi:O-methyltransferase involved in polyketide biosynthesis